MNLVKVLNICSNYILYYVITKLNIEQVPGVGDGQGSLVCCSPWGLKELGTTEQQN